MNILLDTNVVSEAMHAQSNPTVQRWMSAQRDSQRLFVSAITQSEMLLGVRTLPLGKRRQALAQALDKVFDTVFSGRVLPFDSNCAPHYADIVAARREIGRPIGQSDAQIAAVALTRGMSVATRNIRDFEGCGLNLINPWLSD